MRTRFCFVAILITLLATVTTRAQQITTGVIQGTVTDATGAALPGVTIEARNVNTNLVRSQVTESDGRFVFLQLPPGTYTLKFTLTGFATHVQENVELTVGQTITLPIAHEGLRPVRDGDRYRHAAGHRIDPHGGGHHAERADGRTHCPFSAENSRISSP